jgi:hypothetical protein
MTDAIAIVQYELSKKADNSFLDAVAIINALIKAGYMMPQAIEPPKLSVVVPFKQPDHVTAQLVPISCSRDVPQTAPVCPKPAPGPSGTEA